MKRLLLLFITILQSCTLTVLADEGMWIPMLIDRLNYQDMQKLGLKLTPEEIYSVNNSSLKDAIVQFGRGCTGEIISDQGLLITNHHCGYGQLQTHSSIEHDYLKDGFWAMSMEEELPNPGLTVSFLVRIEDVTSQVLGALTPDMTEDQRTKKISEIGAEISKKATEGTIYDASVRGFFGGNEFYLFVYEVFKDVRLVGAPPSSIGNFGGDTDNWMWPRQTGDFSMFRVYSGRDGKPAEYSKDNIPLKPKYFLPISLDGYDKGDFAMVLGYPGGTDRYLTSWGVNLAVNTTNPAVVKIRREKLDIIEADMAASDEVRIKYASKHNRISNYWKYYIGQTKGLKRLDVYDQKVAIENDFMSWVNADPERTAKYGNTLKDIENAYKTISEFALAGVYYREAILRGPEILGFAYRFHSLADELKADKPDQGKINSMVKSLRVYAEAYFKDYNLPTDKALMLSMAALFNADVPVEQQPFYFRNLVAKCKECFCTLADAMFEKSIFTSLDKVNMFLDKPDDKAMEKDPAYKFYLAFNDKYTELQKSVTEANSMLDKGNRFFITGLREMHPEKKFYPNANGTMRLTYGTVEDYYPADATYYSFFTTLDGVMEKEDPSNNEFIVSQKLKDLYNEKDYGLYGQGGTIHTCFLTTNDITGGNSGSPVINSEGELLGLAFDGNWEAMSGDIAYETEYQRTICVDIRYVLFIIDKYAGAKNLIREMKLMQKPPAILSKDTRKVHMVRQMVEEQ